MKIHCTSCSQVLRVPKTATGRWCRCPACKTKFKIPQPKDLLDETISTWIEEDVEELIDEKNKQILQITQMQRQAIRQDHLERVNATAGRLQKVLDAPAQIHDPKAPATPARTAAATAAAIRPSNSPATSKKVRHAVNLNRQNDDPAATDHVGASGYPDHMFPTHRRPYLVVDHCDQQGVTLAFDAEFLTDRSFTTSLPMRCVFTGEKETNQLLARPLAFCDRAKGEQISPHQIESGHEAHLGKNIDPLQLLDNMGVIEQLSSPFEHPMPYFLSASQSTLSLACWSHTRATDHGITAYVQIPEGFYALEWLGRVNGTCGPEYAKLKIEVESLFGGEWRQLGEDCRRRLAVWCPFEAGERFCHFVTDADFNHHDMGLAGLVLTDRRLVYHKYHKRGQMHYNQGASILIEPGKQGLAVVSIQGPDPKKNKSKDINLHLQEIPRLIAAAAFVKLPAKVKIEHVKLDGLTLPDGQKISIDKDGDVATQQVQGAQTAGDNQVTQAIQATPAPSVTITLKPNQPAMREPDLATAEQDAHHAAASDVNDMTIEGLMVQGLASDELTDDLTLQDTDARDIPV